MAAGARRSLQRLDGELAGFQNLLSLSVSPSFMCTWPPGRFGEMQARGGAVPANSQVTPVLLIHRPTFQQRVSVLPLSPLRGVWPRAGVPCPWNDTRMRE